jgi:hypothetical protein
MADIDLKRTLDDALAGLGEMHHAMVAQLQKANEDDAQDYVKFLESQLESIAHVSKCVETASQAKPLPFV